MQDTTYVHLEKSYAYFKTFHSVEILHWCAYVFLIYDKNVDIIRWNQ